jgi:hypothetical protein
MNARAWDRRGGLGILIVIYSHHDYLCFRTFSPISDPRHIIEKLDSCAADLQEDMVDVVCFLAQDFISPHIPRNVLVGLVEPLLSNIS